MNQWIDITVPLRNGMTTWPDNPPPRIDVVMDLNQGHEATVSRLTLGSHTGTHMDAPRHFLRTGKGLDDMPLTATIGPARVVEIGNPEAITIDEVKALRLRKGERLLFKTRNSRERWADRPFTKDFVYLTTEAARWLAARGVQTVGVDYLSVGGYQKNGPEVHRVLLEAGVWIIEGLVLSAVRPGPYELICLPLMIVNSDGAPARAVLRRA